MGFPHVSGNVHECGQYILGIVSKFALSEFKQTSKLLFPRKLIVTYGLWFSDDFRGDIKLINLLTFA